MNEEVSIGVGACLQANIARQARKFACKQAPTWGSRFIPHSAFRIPHLTALAFLLALPVYAQETEEPQTPDTPWWQVWQKIPGLSPQIEEPGVEYTENPVGNNTESMLLGQPRRQWVQDATLFSEAMEPVIEENIIEPLPFEAVADDISPESVEVLKEKLAELGDAYNLKLHFIGHTDSEPLTPQQLAEYLDKTEFTRARAQLVAEFFQLALDLPEEAISFEGRGDVEPVADNITTTGRELNRRVQVRLSYDELDEEAQAEQARAQALALNRVKVCRQETVCRLRYTAGSEQRARLKNLVTPLRIEPGQVDLPEAFARRIREVRANLADKNNLVIHFVGHTDSLPLPDRPAQLYSDHMALSRAEARRVALAVRDMLGLPSYAVTSSGKGASQPIANNDTPKGRALNRRVEVEFWYDDPMETAGDGVQACPEAASAETITIAHESPTGALQPIRFEQGDPVISQSQLEHIRRLMAEVADKANVRVGFVGYSDNERMERREAMVYGDDVGLSSARARRAMEAVQQHLNLSDEQVEFEGRGYVQSDDVVTTGFIQLDGARVEVQVLYDELAVLADKDRLEIERIQREARANNPYALNLMRITVDGEPEYDPYKNSADLQRCTDVALESANIQFRFDNKKMQPRLNVSAWPNTIRYADDPETEVADSRVQFRSYTNYPSFIERAEVRLFEEEQSVRDMPLAVVELDVNGRGEWEAELEEFRAPLKKLQYLLRVYDEKGRYDETEPQTLWLVDRLDAPLEDTDVERELLVGYGENRLAHRNIPLDGNTVLVNGSQIPAEHTVWLGGNPVPVSGQGEFVAEQIFGKGLHTVEVAVLDEQGNGDLFLRDLRFANDDWFTVGIADLTIGYDKTNGPAALVTGDETHYDNSVSYDGRLAFYTSGGFGEGWRLAASADTEEGPVDELFSNFMEKSPDELFRRMDSDLYYPTFGDDSTVVEDAPTSGKFYVKLSKYDDYGLWGNFKAAYTDNELAHIDRALYGANAHFESDAVTSFGEKRFQIDGFGAEPGTVDGRDEFRGTGGSLYFLRHQDISTGSERLRVEVRDKDSDIVLAVRNLTAVVDYDIDYIQGRVLLNKPLSALANDNLLIQDGAFNGNPQYLVARYEYTPGFEEMDTLAVGGRAHYWLGDYVKLGISGTQQDEEDNESSLHGVDLTLRKSAGSWLKMEVADSQGGNLDRYSSLDGGYSFGNESALDPDAKAGASRVEASLQLADFFESARGSGTLYHQEREAGFSAPGQETLRDTTQYGASVNLPIGERFDVGLKADSKEQDLGLHTEAVDMEVGYRISDRWRLATAARADTREDFSPVVPATQTQGDRTDMAVEAAYNSGENWSAFGFVQRTLEVTGTREENDRVGLGGAYRVSERLTLDSELSGGDTGTAARLGTDYLISDRTNLYLNYALDNERTDTGLRARKGNMSTGFRSRYSDTLSIYGEERYSHGDVSTGLTHALGVDLAPSDRWSYGTSVEAGTLEDPRTGAQTERRAVGLSMGYDSENTRLSSAVEYRTDIQETPVDESTVSESERDTWLLKNTFSYQVSPDWRLVGKLNYSDSKSSQGEFYDGKYTEGVVGYAYRPVDNDRWNTLLKYTYFYNVPTSDQVTVNNTATEFIQKSHIFSVDTTYDISRRWSLGGKYAYRLGQVSLDREDPEFFDSRASLYVLRADWHFVNRWDLLVEGRMLDLPDAEDSRSGFLVGLYRHMGKHLKVGLGYNFTDFSDDLTQLDFDSQGVFLNVVGKL
ncbi:OmpA family protein [Microbulbifer rhizosphaerae]|uniref:Flagellar motor protein MotB n=1 Tax=Microbulbifer rhizosphaerae TaxID=1562603 RepID=A0A7W4Z8V9_9GAMM|nr:OmpA family protein [Microbulbifer rhizosphaerae]MBB3059624.1 flagellar motor protein MotB [Microbulbifer rhizosphaerae]